jgi:ABC-type nitrate/sulfonate/bicarbonate transport system substrate-binding protein
MTQHISRRKALQLLGGGTLAAAIPGIVLAQKGETLHFGIQTTIWGAAAIVAEEEKSFSKAGLDVVVDKFDSGANARDAMIGGHIDTVSIGATPFVIGAVKSNLVAIGMVSYAGGTLAVVAGKKSGIKTVADLKGKKVASQLGSQTDEVFQHKIAPAFGLKPGDFQVVNTKFRDHVSALASGSVDAFAGVEPYPSVAELEGIGNILTDYSKYDIVPVILATNRDVLAKRKADLVKFMKGWVAVCKFCREQPDKAAHIVGDFFRKKGYTMKDDVFKLALKHMDMTPTFKPELKPYLKTLADNLVKSHKIPSAPDIDKIVTDEILKQV